MGRLAKQSAWRATQLKSYTLQFMHSTGIPDAIEKASTASGENPSAYIKKAIVTRLQSEGFLSGDVILNRNEEKHKEKLQRLKEYIEAEEAKDKK